MKAAVLHSPGDIRIEDIDKPKLESEEEIIIRIVACGICGTDLHFYKYGLFPNVGKRCNSGWRMGHEFSGDIVEIGGEVKGLKKGDRVVAIAQGGQAEYLKIGTTKNGWNVIPIPPGISYEEAATTEPLATSLHAVHLALRSQKREHFIFSDPGNDPAYEETAVVFGAGIIGLGVLQILKATTKSKVVMVDISKKRLAVAQKLGADVIVNADEEDPCEKMMDMTGRQDLRYAGGPASGVDTVYDCVGAPRGLKGQAPFQQAVAMVRPGGKIVIVAFFEMPLEIEVTDVVAKNISLYGSLEWSGEEFTQAFELISSGRIDRKAIITHEYSLADVKEAYDIQSATDEAVKVMVKP